MCDRHIVIDPILIAVPADPAAYVAYLHRLIDWLSCLSEYREICSIPSEAVYRLMDIDRYPNRSRIAEVLRSVGDPSITLIDVLNLVRVIAESEPFLEHHTRLKAGVVGRLTIDPTSVVDRQPTEVREPVRVALGLASLARQNGWASRSARLATLREEDWPAEVRVEGELAIVELLDGGYLQDQQVAGLFAVMASPDSIDCDLSIQELWTDCKAALGWLARVNLSDADRASANPSAVCYGAAFVESVCQCGIDKQPAVLEQLLMRGLLAGMGRLKDVAGAKLHPCRESEDANAAQRVRDDGAKLWRCMVTRTGAGYRLHYWSRPDGRVELDSVMVESEA